MKLCLGLGPSDPLACKVICRRMCDFIDLFMTIYDFKLYSSRIWIIIIITLSALAQGAGLIYSPSIIIRGSKGMVKTIPNPLLKRTWAVAVHSLRKEWFCLRLVENIVQWNFTNLLVLFKNCYLTHKFKEKFPLNKMFSFDHFRYNLVIYLKI